MCSDAPAAEHAVQQTHSDPKIVSEGVFAEAKQETLHLRGDRASTMN